MEKLTMTRNLPKVLVGVPPILKYPFCNILPMSKEEELHCIDRSAGRSAKNCVQHHNIVLYHLENLTVPDHQTLPLNHESANTIKTINTNPTFSPDHLQHPHLFIVDATFFIVDFYWLICMGFHSNGGVNDPSFVRTTDPLSYNFQTKEVSRFYSTCACQLLQSAQSIKDCLLVPLSSPLPRLLLLYSRVPILIKGTMVKKRTPRIRQDIGDTAKNLHWTRSEIGLESVILTSSVYKVIFVQNRSSLVQASILEKMISLCNVYGNICHMVSLDQPFKIMKKEPSRGKNMKIPGVSRSLYTNQVSFAVTTMLCHTVIMPRAQATGKYKHTIIFQTSILY
ncbi:hypothetical protein C0J52_07696 [Blattella germanica]|nr:hypothetical protein C0J52_07696 [Blattella germanica]